MYCTTDQLGPARTVSVSGLIADLMSRIVSSLNVVSCSSEVTNNGKRKGYTCVNSFVLPAVLFALHIWRMEEVWVMATASGSHSTFNFLFIYVYSDSFLMTAMYCGMQAMTIFC